MSRAQYFEFANYSVPKDDPIHNAPNAQMLVRAIRNQMQFCDVIVILAGVYSSYSKWINAEIVIAQEGFQNPKPILAIEPFASERTSMTVKASANKIVSWNTNSIVSAIRELAR
jgi:hypothetical protein